MNRDPFEFTVQFDVNKIITNAQREFVALHMKKKKGWWEIQNLTVSILKAEIVIIICL